MKIPASLRDLARVIGDHNVLNLIDRFGGTTISEVPRSTKSRAGFMLALDEEGREAICKNFKGERIYIPRQNDFSITERNAAIIRLYQSGQSASYIARNFKYSARLSERAVFKILHDYKNN